MKIISCLIPLLFPLSGVPACSQSPVDSFKGPQKEQHVDSTVIELRSGELLIYKKPKPFGFVTQVPRTLAHAAKMSFRKKSVGTLAAVTGMTVGLIFVDRPVTDGAQQFGNYINLDGTRSYGKSIGFNLGKTRLTLFEVPKNLNTGIYALGEGLSSVLLSAGLFGYGKIKRDYRAIQSASQILQAQITVGILTQSLKRISGRESPFYATAPGGVWRPLPGFSEYQNNTARYDAFPSGHLATMMATVTVLAMNYPEKKWIRIVGGGLIGLVGFSMINNGVHWSSDYPLALGIGYVVGCATVKMNRVIRNDRHTPAH